MPPALGWRFGASPSAIPAASSAPEFNFLGENGTRPIPLLILTLIRTLLRDGPGALLHEKESASTIIRSIFLSVSTNT